MKIDGTGAVRLSSKHTIPDYLKMVAGGDKEGIANFIGLRHRERYIYPVEHSESKNGFAAMALACLLIETLQSFREGLKDTKGSSRRMFKNFLKDEPEFAVFSAIANDFYDNIRCGILHQGESRGGWTVNRRGPLLENKQINAGTFLEAVGRSLERYCNELKAAKWDSAIWEKCRLKMQGIIENCET